ncbi:TraB/GumN family protein [Fluviicola chungangensis]|uniref:TraB/GumN family protein n=2 Tax=Fluviicola chungangensis TaxID=2597671 RepID=A0A556N3F1_9FLAO|nr:TraB/GumN family protein [Fluviicola chungangensis]
MYKIGCMLFLFHCFQAFGQEVEKEYQLLWEVKAPRTKKISYIFGSMHSNDPRLFNFPDSLYSAFVSVDAVVLETDVTQIYDQYDVRLNLFNFDLFDKERSFASSKKATQTVYGSEDGRPQFLDAYFQQAGYCGGKGFYQLETVQDQLKLAENPELFNTRRAINGLFFTKEAFIQTYINGDIASLTNMLKSQFKSAPDAYDELITKRNQIMAKGLDTLMRKRTVFCAIGSGHLHGTDGVLQLLRQKGFQVRAVKATYDNTTVTEKKLVQSWRTFAVSDEENSFRMTFGGKPTLLEETDKKHYIYQELGQGNTYELVIHASPDYLDDNRYHFLENDMAQTKEFFLDDGAKGMEGLILDPIKGYQWKRFIQFGDVCYELICYGGNKFMHSDRPVKFFQKFEILTEKE